MLARPGFWRRLYLTQFSRPRGDRVLYRLLARRPVKHILEVGVGQGQRGARLLEMAARHTAPNELRYSGIDRFELRNPEEGPGLRLKDAYRHFRATGARVRLVPGDPLTALAYAANSLAEVDLLIIGAKSGAAEPGPAWFYIPRMLSQRAMVIIEEPFGRDHRFRRVSPQEIAERAARPATRRAA